MARNRINTFSHNKNVNKRTLTREQVVREGFDGKSGESLNSEVENILKMQYMLDADYRKKLFDFNNTTNIISANSINTPDDKYAPINGIENIYNTTLRQFYSDSIAVSKDIVNLNKHQTGEQLINNAVKINEINYSRMMTKANTSVTSLKEAYGNFKNVDSFYVFDTETLSGMGATGYNELDGLQEIAFRQFNKVGESVVENEATRIETLIGINKKDYDKYYDVFVNNYNESGWEGNQKYKVIAERFAKLGHEDTVIKNAGKGIAITEAFASDSSKNLMSIDNIKRGLKRAKELGDRQSAERLDNGLMVWEDMLLNSVNIFNDNFVAGYNSTNFDFEKMNQSVAKTWNKLNDAQKKEYRTRLGISANSTPVINPAKGMYMDVRDPVRMMAEITGKTGLYEDSDLGTIKALGKTLLQQESLGEIYAKNAMFTAAHTAGADVTVLANLMHGNGGALLDKAMEVLEGNSSKIQQKVNGNSVLMATQGEFFNDFTRKGALTFTEDKTTGALRTGNGYSLDSDGTTRELGKYGNARGIKKDVAYQIGFMGELDMSEAWTKEMAGPHQDYAQGKLWQLTLNPLVDKKIAGDNNVLKDPTTYFFTSQQAMEGFVSSHFANVGSFDGKEFKELEDIAAREEISKLYGLHSVTDGNVSEGKQLSVKDLVGRGTTQSMNDPAARMIRENEYSKAVKFGKVQDYLVENGADTIEKQKKILSQITAENVASGKPLRIKHDILNILGYKDIKYNKDTIYSSTINNTINGYEYLSSQRGIMDAVIKSVKGMGDLNSQQRQYAYNTIMNSVLDEAETSFGNSNQQLSLYGKDLNYFDFNMPSNYFEETNTRALPGEIDNVLRVNLNAEKEYSLVNDLLRKRKGDDRIIKNKKLRESYGKNELINFISNVNDSEEYKGIFENILDIANEDISVDALAEKTIFEMKKFREGNPTAGYSKARDYQNVLEAYSHADKVTGDFLDTAINNAKASLPSMISLDTGNKEAVEIQIEKMVDEILMPTIRQEDGTVLKGIDNIVSHAQKTYGFNEKDLELFRSNLNFHKEAHMRGMTNLVKSATQNGGFISYDTASQKIGLTADNQTYNLFGLAKTRLENGVLHHKINNSKFEASLKFRSLDAMTGTPDYSKIGFASNLDEAYDALKYLNLNTKRSLEKGDGIAPTLLRGISNFSNKAREISTLGNLTTKDSNSWKKINLEEAILSMPSILQDIMSYDKWQDKDFKKIISKNADSINKGIVNSEVIEAFGKNKQDVIKILLGIGAGQKNQLENANQVITNNISNYLKDTALAKSIYSTGTYEPIAMLPFDNPSRPPINSADNMMFNKKKMDDSIKNNPKLKGKVSTGANIISEAQLTNRIFNGVGEVGESLTFKNASISEKNFKDIAKDHYDKIKNNKNVSKEKKEWAKKVYEGIKGANLTEQGKLLDGYVAELMLTATETQKIGTLKNFAKDISVNSEQMKKRIANAMPVIEIAKSGDVVFRLGKEDYVKRSDTLFTLDAFNGSIDTIGVKENAGFFGFNYTSKGTDIKIENEEISKFLSKNKKSITNIDGTVNSQKAMDLLEQEFSSNYYVRNAFTKGYNKGTSEYAEKGMYEALLSGAGTIDNNVKKLIHETGLIEADGRILSNDFIEQVLKSKYSDLSEEQKREIGLGTWNSVVKAINKEKFAKSDYMREIFGDTMAYTVDNVSKHGNAGFAMKKFIADIANLDNGSGGKLGYEKAHSIINGDEDGFERLIHGLDTKMVDGKLVIGNVEDGLDTYIDKDAVSNTIEKLGMYKDDPSVITRNGEKVGLISEYSTSFNHDFSGTSRSNNDIAEMQNKLDETRKSLKVFKDIDEESDEYKRLKDIEIAQTHNLNSARRYNKSMKISSRDVNMLGLYTYEDKVMEGLKETLGDDTYKKIFDRMIGEDGALNEEYHGKKINSAFIDNIKDRAVAQAEDSKENIMDMRDAIKFNNSNNDAAALRTIKEKGFEEIGIDDLITVHGKDTEFLLGDKNSSIGKNFLLDTGMEGSNKYIAIAANDYKLTGDTLTNDEVQKSLSKLKNARNALTEGREGHNLNGRTIEDLEANVMNAANEVKTSLVTTTKKAVKGLDNVNIGGYSYDKATAAFINPEDLAGEFVGDKSYKMYNVSSMNGKTLGQWASEGVHYDASWQGIDYFENLGYFKEENLEKYGKTRAEMIEHLERVGTGGVETRTPVIKEGSTSFATQFLDSSLANGQTKSTGPMVFGRNQDHDGDNVIRAELSYEHSGSKYTKLDYDLRKDALPEEAKQYFEEINASMTMRAATINKKVHDSKGYETYMKDEVEMATKDVRDVLDSSKVNTNAEGRVMPFSGVEYDTSQRNDYLEKYNELKSGVMDRLGQSEAEFSKLDPLEQSNQIHKEISSLAEDVQEQYKVAARFGEVYQKDMASVMSKISGKVSIGYINTPLAKTRLFAEAEGFSSQQRQYLQSVADVLEQNIISKKHATDYEISIAQTFRSFIGDTVEGKQSGIDGVKSLIQNGYEDAIIDKIRLTSMEDLSDMSNKQISDNIYNVMDDIGTIFKTDKTAKSRFISSMADRGINYEGTNIDEVINATTSASSSLASYSMAEAGYATNKRAGTSAKVNMDGFEKGSRRVVSEIGEAVQDMAASSSGLAKAALGMAAAVMMTGYIGGNPTIAPGHEAEELNQYDSLQDKDLSIQSLPQGAGQGYVVNINAQSNQGKEHAMQAIQKAMQSSVTTDINVSMNMNDKTSNINSRLIDKLLLGAL